MSAEFGDNNTETTGRRWLQSELVKPRMVFNNGQISYVLGPKDHSYIAKGLEQQEKIQKGEREVAQWNIENGLPADCRDISLQLKVANGQITKEELRELFPPELSESAAD